MLILKLKKEADYHDDYRQKFLDVEKDLDDITPIEVGMDITKENLTINF